MNQNEYIGPSSKYGVHNFSKAVTLHNAKRISFHFHQFGVLFFCKQLTKFYSQNGGQQGNQ